MSNAHLLQFDFECAVGNGVIVIKSSGMGNKLSVTEAVLLGTTGLLGALALQYRKESRVQERRKNELAWSLLNVKPTNDDAREASSEYGRNFKPRPSDVFIVTYPKCGTTWMSQICHMLRGGDMDFGEITEVCPWDEVAMICGQGSYLLIHVSDEKFQKIIRSTENIEISSQFKVREN